MFERVMVIVLFILLIAGTFFFVMHEKEEPVEHTVKPVVMAKPIPVPTSELIKQVCDVDNFEAKHLASMVDAASKVEKTSVDIIVAVISTESNCKWIVGDNGRSIGYGQIQTRFYSSGNYDPTNPLHNVYLTARILQENYKDTGKWKHAIEVYNIGKTNFRKNKARISGRNYVKKVSGQLAIIEHYRQNRGSTLIALR